MGFNIAEICPVPPPPQSDRDGGIAGAGVLLSFIITNLICLGLAVTITFYELKGNHKSTKRRRLLQAFSDQQIVTGIGVVIIGLAQMESIIFYHFLMVWLLGCLATVCNMATTLALVADFRVDWVMMLMRQSMMTLNLILSEVAGVFILKYLYGHGASTWPIICAWDGPFDASAVNMLSVVGTISVMTGQILLFAIGITHLNIRERRWTKKVQAFVVVLLVIMSIAIIIRIVTMADAFKYKAEQRDKKLKGTWEGQWTYGQLLSMLLLWLPILGFLEIWRAECVHKKARRDAEKAGDRIPLRDHDEDIGFRSVTPVAFFH